ncbi:MAG: hotdog domain-containing protein [Candidatus Acidiferrales bacterium]
MKRSVKRAKRVASAKRPKSRKPVNVQDERKPRIGLAGVIERVVPHGWTIAAWDPGLPAVLSTPAMIGMMEIAAAESVKPDLPPGAITVGTRIEVDHLKAVPEGATVRATSRLVKHQGRFLVFEVEARSGENILGRGRVFRAIVEPQKFSARADSRKES